MTRTVTVNDLSRRVADARIAAGLGYADEYAWRAVLDVLAALSDEAAAGPITVDVAAPWIAATPITLSIAKE